jgi:hypothetical protein
MRVVGRAAPLTQDAALPRTLVVSESPFCRDNGFGVTLHSCFDGWPSEALVQLYTRAGSTPSSDRCRRMHFADIPGHRGRRHGIDWFLGRRPAWRGRFSRPWLRRTLGNWRPDVVYTLMFSVETLAYAAWIAEQFDCPLVAHVADDGIGRDERAKASVQALLEAASSCVVISHEMRAEYASRYGVTCEVLHNGAADELFTRHSRPAADGPFRVRYLGSVIPEHHYHAIEDVGAAVRAAGEAGCAARFELCGGAWTRQHAEHLADGHDVVYRGAVTTSEGVDLLKTADLLVVPVTFDPSAFARVRFSLPTKLAECLASGTPTLVYGPRGCGPVEFCRRHGVGSVIDERSVERLTAFITWLAGEGRSSARRRAERDREFIRSHYTARIARDRFRAILCEASRRAS